MTVLTPEQVAHLDIIRSTRAGFLGLEAKIRGELEAEVAARLRAANDHLNLTLARASTAGVPNRQIGLAYGSTDARTVKDRIVAGTALLGSTPGQPSSNDPRAFIQVTRLESGAVELIATEVPPGAWSYTKGLAAKPTVPYSGTVQSQPNMPRIARPGDGRSPLWAEWISWLDAGTTGLEF